MTVIQAMAIGLLGGTLGTTGIYIWIEGKSKNWEKVQENQSETLLALSSIQSDISKGKIDIQKNLTAPDLLNVACSKEYLLSSDDLLCREMFCRLQTREGDGAAQSECEEISNVSNSLSVLKDCAKLGLETEVCISYIGKRK
jgi:hypothetical protein|tara:strand:- start:6541 stop:6966 length:426 start_codon:yes stop_codon:yes gene_type:complete